MIENHVVYRRNDGYVGMSENKLPTVPGKTFTELGRFPGYVNARYMMDKERKVEGSWG